MNIHDLKNVSLKKISGPYEFYCERGFDKLDHSRDFFNFGKVNIEREPKLFADAECSQYEEFVGGSQMHVVDYLKMAFTQKKDEHFNVQVEIAHEAMIIKSFFISSSGASLEYQVLSKQHGEDRIYCYTFRDLLQDELIPGYSKLYMRVRQVHASEFRLRATLGLLSVQELQ